MKKNVLAITVCAIIVAVFTGIGAICIRPTESVTEKRSLAKFPKFTVSGLIDGSFMKGIVTWYSDTFPIREGMISINSDSQNLFGFRKEKLVVNDPEKKADKVPSAKHVKAAKTMKIPVTKDEDDRENASETDIDPHAEDGSIKDTPEKVGSIYIAGGSGFSVYQFSKNAVDSYASMVNTVAEKLGTSYNVYAIPTPDNFGVMLPEKTQKSLSQYEGDAFDYIYRRFSDRVNVVETFNELVNHNSEYIYFHTDHHWTALGAYYAYRQYCKVKGFTPHEISEYEKQESKGFLGSFYSFSRQSPELAKNPDTIYAYKPLSTNNMTMINHQGKKTDYMIIQPGKSYSVFIGSDEPWEEIDNPKINDGSACVVIKDSYGNAFVPFLVDHYDKVYVIDFRYYKQDLTQMIKDDGIKDVIFMNNVEFMNKSNSEKILSLFRFDRH